MYKIEISQYKKILIIEKVMPKNIKEHFVKSGVIGFFFQKILSL